MSKKILIRQPSNLSDGGSNKLPLLEKTWSKRGSAGAVIQTLPSIRETDVHKHPSPYVIAVMPAFNAEKTIRQTHAAIPHQHVHQVIVVDDASHDNTVAVSRSLDNTIVITHETNRGYGGNQKTCYF